MHGALVAAKASPLRYVRYDHAPPPPMSECEHSWAVIFGLWLRLSIGDFGTVYVGESGDVFGEATRNRCVSCAKLFEDHVRVRRFLHQQPRRPFTWLHGCRVMHRGFPFPFHRVQTHAHALAHTPLRTRHRVPGMRSGVRCSRPSKRLFRGSAGGGGGRESKADRRRGRRRTGNAGRGLCLAAKRDWVGLAPETTS
eukprot:6213667-Pleurochrysis_carterae.AAC.1